MDARNWPVAEGTAAVAAAGAVLPGVASKPVCNHLPSPTGSRILAHMTQEAPLLPRKNTSVHAAATTGNALAVIAASISSWCNCTVSKICHALIAETLQFINQLTAASAQRRGGLGAQCRQIFMSKLNRCYCSQQSWICVSLMAMASSTGVKIKTRETPCRPLRPQFLPVVLHLLCP